MNSTDSKSLLQCVQEIQTDYSDVALRVSLADALQSHHQSKQAEWMRFWLARHESIAPLATTMPTTAVMSRIQSFSHAPNASDDPAHQLQSWETIRPSYWQTPRSCRLSNYFGRWIVSCWAVNSPPNREQIDELATMDWLEGLWSDGFLELVEFHLGRPETVDWFLALPENIRRLPLCLNTARAAGPGFDIATVRRLVATPSLQGIYLTLGLISSSVVTQLSSTARGLQFLAVEFHSREKELEDLVGELIKMPKLRYLSLYGSRLTANTITSLKNSSSIQSIGLSVSRLELAVLMEVGKVPHLKWLGINSSSVSREDIEAFRNRFPQIALLLSSEMQVRLGLL